MPALDVERSEGRVDPRMDRTVAVDVVHSDILDVRADVIALKYAQALYGADALVSRKLTARQIPFPRPGRFRFEDGASGIAAPRILFVGVPPLRQFGYRDIRAFARTVLWSLSIEAPTTEHVAVTVHGPGYGLDEMEAFEAELAGFVDAVQNGDAPELLRRISVVEQNR